MAVHDTLRVARSAGRVTHARGLVFIGNFRKVDRLFGGKEVFVVEQCVARKILRDIAFAIVHQHEMPEVRKRREERREERQNRTVNENHFIVCVINDVRQLLGEKTDVERVEHPARARRCEVQLEVASCVPCKRCNATVGGDAQCVQRTGQLPGASSELGVCCPLEACPRRRNDLLVAVVLLGPVEDVIDRERYVLHKPLHMGRT